MSNLKLWQRLAVDRALVAELSAMEVEEAKIIGDPERLTIADRYHNQAVRLLATAQRKLAEFAAVPGVTA
ncbi:hypothetical protein [Ensifer aridi]|uniref:hypothetical protein n=1 Tax=Ensifer aridi TaxID=1708715 RepID=UPI000A1157B8|nr:hypothetical protein [Ensifer aridi]